MADSEWWQHQLMDQGPIGWVTGRDQDYKAQQMMDKARAEYEGITPPSVESMQINPQALGPSQMAGAQADPMAIAAQRQALAEIQGNINRGGLSAQAQANLSQIGTNQAAQERGAREALSQNARMRGVGGSGLEFMLANQAGQAAANRGSQAALDVAAQQENARNAAISQLAQTGGQMRGQSFDEQARRAQAADEINRFNTMQSNAAQMYNRGLYQQDYQNKLGLAGAKANVYNNQAGFDENSADRQRQMIGGYLNAAGSLGGAAATKSDKRAKTNIGDGGSAIESLLNSLSAKSFDYKDKKDGKGRQTGIMAQDLEKTPAGKAAVIDTPNGKMVDGAKAATLALAGVAHLHKKMKGGR